MKELTLYQLDYQGQLNKQKQFHEYKGTANFLYVLIGSWDSNTSTDYT